jgi:esterase
MKLFYKKIGEGKEPLIILHGLFGSSDNWTTLAKGFSEYFDVYLVDQRNHGRSPWSNDFNYTLLAEDLKELLDDLNLEKVYIIGHSMGGKTAMYFAQMFPKYIEKLIVADIGVKSYPMHHEQILKGLKHIDLKVVDTRKVAEQKITEYIPDSGTKQFLLKNLYWKEKGVLAWRINISVLEKSMPQILGAVPRVIAQAETLFIRGTKSKYIIDEDWEGIEEIFPYSDLESLDCGHWLHAEKPKEFYNLVLEFLV